MSVEATVQPIPLPADFPVTWEQPDDERLTWMDDRLHIPGQSLPIDVSLWQILYEGLATGNASYGIPTNFRLMVANTYLYTTNVAPPPTEEQGGVIQERVGAAMGQLQTLWDDEWLPEIQAHIRFWEGFDLAAASMSELVEHLDKSVEHLRQVFDLHFRIVNPLHIATSVFDDFYQEVLGTDSPFSAYALLEGFPNKTVEMGQAMFRLSRQALQEPVVAAALLSEENDPREQLEQTAPGRHFLAALNDFLQEYGHRSERLGVSNPSWIEDPTPVYQALRGYLAQPDLDLDADLAAAAKRRDERIAAVRTQLQGYPQPVVEQFEFLLRAAQVANVLSEDHGFWIDYQCVNCFRQVIREFGRRFAAAGAIEAPGDVVYLSLEEVRTTAMAESTPDRRALVTARKAEHERFANVQAPPVIGTLPPAGPPDESAGARALQKFFGGPPPSGSTPDLIRGNSGSAGKVQGRVKVVHGLAEASKLAPGDILVAVTTAPPWTPLFATVAAVVTDTGGVLSHCAVVAREYGIPAVVGTGVATAFLHDDQWVEVDGDAGTVRVLTPA